MLRVICLLLASLPASMLAQSSVWKVSNGEQSLYIGGTCHMLRASDYPLPAEFDLAYAAADTLVFEIDPAAAQDPAFAMQLFAQASYTDGRSLKTVLSDKAYRALETQGKQSGIPIEVLNGIKPGMALMMLTLQELTKLGVSQEGVDMYYHHAGLRDGKSVKALETTRFQIELLTTLGEGIESEFVLFGLQDLDQIQSQFDELIDAWKQGDMPALEKRFIADIAMYPELYAKMLVDRNQRWIPQIKAFLQTPAIELVLVGVAHAAGEDGLLHLLAQQGYSIEQVNAAPAED